MMLTLRELSILQTTKGDFLRCESCGLGCFVGGEDKRHVVEKGVVSRCTVSLKPTESELSQLVAAVRRDDQSQGGAQEFLIPHLV